MPTKYKAVAYCQGTGLALTSGDKSFYMNPSGRISEKFKLFPQSAVMKHHYIPINPIEGDADTMLVIFQRLEERLNAE